MADPADTIAEEVQAPVDAPQVEEAAPVEAEVVDTEIAPVAEVAVEEDVLVEPVVETVESPSARLSRNEVLEQYGDVIRDERNTAAQLKENELRRESASRENTKAQVKQVADELGITVDDSRLNFMYDNAHGHAEHSLWSGMGEGAITSLGVEGIEAETLRANLQNPTPAAQRAAAAQLIDLSNEKIGVPRGMDRVFEMDITAAIQARPDSLLAQSFRAAKEAAELAAVKASTLNETASESAPPALPTGRALVSDSGDVHPVLTKLETQGRSALSEAELTLAHQLLGVTAR